MKSEVHRIHHSIDPRRTSVQHHAFCESKSVFRSIRGLIRRLLGWSKNSDPMHYDDQHGDVEEEQDHSPLPFLQHVR